MLKHVPFKEDRAARAEPESRGTLRSEVSDAEPQFDALACSQYGAAANVRDRARKDPKLTGSRAFIFLRELAKF